MISNIIRYNGDLFTKVSIGRTKSFVRPGNQQYNLQELFRELKEKEGVDSIDDVLRRVISPDGMSFNDIKPVYRELLLKLAMTMSQDEIFQRSKTIMASTKKRRKRHPPPPAPTNSGSLGSFFKSFSKSSSKNNSLVSKKSLSTAHTTLTSEKSSRQTAVRSQHKPAKSNKTSSGKVLTKADISGPIIMSSKVPAGSKEDLVDDAYMSCSECGTASTYESVCNYEDCSCREKKPARRPSVLESRRSEGSELSETSDCDGESCVSSEKCYCSLRGGPRLSSSSSCCSTSVYSEMTSNTSRSGSQSLQSRDLSGCDSPGTAWRRNMANSAPSRRGEAGGAGGGRRGETSSGYTTHDSYTSQTWLHVKNGRNQIRDGRGSSGGSSCSSESQRSQGSLSSPRSSSLTTSPSQVSIQNNRSQNSKILLVSSVDPRNNNMMYKGELSSKIFWNIMKYYTHSVI